MIHKLITTDEIRNLFNEIENSTDNFFLTGEAGTGKSTFINHFRSLSKKNVAVIAPTGIAALNIRGQTIHSFFRFPGIILTKEVINRFKDRDEMLYKSLDTIVIDEVSMVRADLLDAIDWFMRKFGKDQDKPFGGCQILLVGDPFQLPPVVKGPEEKILQDHHGYRSPYFFAADVYQAGNFQVRKLSNIFRQEDREFIEALNKIRKKNLVSEGLEYINQRAFIQSNNRSTKTTLTTVNKVADNINDSDLQKIEKPSWFSEAKIEGIFPKDKNNIPAKYKLELRVGARVMFCKNGSRWVNGTMGIVHRLEPEAVYVEKDKTNEIVKVEQETWENIQYQYDKQSRIVETKTIGLFKQFPLVLAYAITVNKSQGLTLDRVHIDFSKSPFLHGQTYVALSRCKTLDGITLNREIYPNDIIVDPRVEDFYKKAVPPSPPEPPEPPEPPKKNNIGPILVSIAFVILILVLINIF